MAKKPDTHFYDPEGQMFEANDSLLRTNSIEIAIKHATAPWPDDDASYDGLNHLWGIEALLAASGAPAQSDECHFLREWGANQSFIPDQNLLKLIRETITTITEHLRKAGPQDNKSLKNLEAKETATLRRIESLDPRNAIPFSQLMREGLADDGLHPLVSDLPGWLAELLAKVEATIEQTGGNEQANQGYKFDVVPDRDPIDLEAAKSLAALCSQSKEIAHDVLKLTLVPALLRALYQSYYRTKTPHLGSDRRLAEIYRVLLYSAARNPPLGLNQMILPAIKPEAEFMAASKEHPIHNHIVRPMLLQYLLGNWSGVREKTQTYGTKTSQSFPEELWQEIKEPLIEGAEGRRRPFRESDPYDRLIYLSWCAWKSGDWHFELRKLLFGDLHLSSAFKSKIFDDVYESHDPGFPDFLQEFRRSLKGYHQEVMENATIDDLLGVVGTQTTPAELKHLLMVADEAEKGEPVTKYLALANVKSLLAPDEARCALSRYTQQTLKQLALHAGEARPLILSLIEDSEFCELLKLLLGTFSEPLTPSWNYYGPWRDSYEKQLHPSRSVSGVTTFSPLFELLKKAKSETISELATLFSASSDHDLITTYLQLMTETQPDHPEEQEGHLSSAILAMALPFCGTDTQASEFRARQLENIIAHFGGTKSLTKDQTSPDGLSEVYDLILLFGEGAQLSTWNASAAHLSELFSEPALENGGYRLEQEPTTSPGYRVFKGEKLMKRIPSKLTSGAATARFRERSKLLHLLSLAWRHAMIEDYIVTGSITSHEVAGSFEESHGVAPSTLLKGHFDPTRDGDQCKFLVEKIIADALRSDDNLILEDFTFYPKEFLPLLREQGWTSRFDSFAEVHEVYRSFPGLGLSIRCEAISRKADWRRKKLPEPEHRLKITDALRIGGRRWNLDPPQTTRMIEVLFSELAIATAEVAARTTENDPI